MRCREMELDRERGEERSGIVQSIKDALAAVSSYMPCITAKHS